MTPTSSKMNRQSIASFILIFITSFLTLSSCKKNADYPHNEVAKYSSEVLDKWMTMQLRLMRNATGVPNHGFSRHYVYSGIAALESLAPDLHSFDRWSHSWNGLTGLPARNHSIAYHYPANVNAAMAAMNRSFFPNASSADKAAIDSLEAALNAGFLVTQSPEIVNKSNEYGKAVATAVFAWAETDGYKNASAPYTPPTGPGKWVPTPAAYAAPATPYWGNNRPVIAGSLRNTQAGPHTIYSTDPHSNFYQMANYVYDVSQHLTEDNKAAALFWRDVPGVSSPGHWLSILQQVIHKKNSRLDKAALAYALTGAAINDALISCFKSKYHYNLVRPITYIREVIGHTTWNSFLGTPAHPEYSSGHAVLSAAGAAAMQELFGNIGSFTDHTYDYMGFAPRTYTSFAAIGEEAAKSRVYGGIHYQQTADAGLIEGQKVTANIFAKDYVEPGTGGKD